MHALFFYSNPTLTSPAQSSPAKPNSRHSDPQYCLRINFPSLDPRLAASPQRQSDFFLHSTSAPDLVVLSPNSSPKVGSPDSESRGGAQTHPRVASVSRHRKKTQTRSPPPSFPPTFADPAWKRRGSRVSKEGGLPYRASRPWARREQSGTLSCLRHGCVIISRCH